MSTTAITASPDLRARDLALGTPALRSLTGLRWVAAAAVFLYHLRNMRYVSGAPQAVLGAIVGPGFTGVSLFFLLSGFVLTWSARSGSGARGFYRRRIARILPSHLVALVVAVVLAATLVPSIRTANPWAVAADAGLVSAWVPAWWQAGNPVSWTLVCEAFFYACFPLLVAGASRFGPRGLRILLAVATALAVAAAVLADVVPHFSGFAFFPAARLPEFVAGIALALLVRRGHLAGPHPAVAVAVVLAGWATASALLPKNAESTVAFTLLGYLALLAALATRDVRGASSPLARSALVRLGELSYAFYLVHLLAIQAVGAVAGKRHGLPVEALLALLALGVALGAAVLLHRLVERPAQRLILGRPRPS